MKKPPQAQTRVLYWMILSRPLSAASWFPVPYIPIKGRCGNRFATQARAEKCAAHLADRSSPIWWPKTKSWVAMEYTVAQVRIPTQPHTFKGK